MKWRLIVRLAVVYVHIVITNHVPTPRIVNQVFVIMEHVRTHVLMVYWTQMKLILVSVHTENAVICFNVLTIPCK
jgi:hypothetical protein